MKFKSKIENVRYYRYYNDDFFPGALWFKRYFVGNNKIHIDFAGIYDLGTYRTVKIQPRPFLDPDRQK